MSVVYAQSGVIAYRMSADDAFILLVTSRRRKRWIIPKGLVEAGMTAAESAIQEAYEEAGVRGAVVGDAIGTYEYKKWGGTCSVDVYLMRAEHELEDWPESHFRDRIWVGIDEALRLVDSADLCRLIRRAFRIIR